MIPYRVTAPTDPVVPLPDLKAHLAVTFADDDAVITAYESAAAAHLDGYTGILGRCINQQTWRIDLDGPGCIRSPFPDVTAIAVKDGQGEAWSDFITGQDAVGTYVDVAGTGPFGVEFTCAMPDDLKPAAVMAIKMMVAHWYADREGAETLPPAVTALVSALRVVGI